MKCLISLLVGMLCIPCLALSQREEWSMVNGDARHTSHAVMTLGFPFQLEEEYDAGFNTENGLIVTSDYIFIQNNADSNELIAIDRYTGDSLWMFGITGSGGSADCFPAAADGIVLAGGQSADGIWGLDQQTGTVIWFLPVRSLYTRSPVICNGKVFIPAIDSLVCADLQTGEVLWAYRSFIPQISPVCDNDNVYFGSGGRIYALDVDDGSESWSADVLNGTFDSYSLGDDLLFVSQNLRAINALDKSNGDLVWHVALDTNERLLDYPGAFALAEDALLAKYFVDESDRNHYLVLDRNTGFEMGRFQGGIKTFNGPTAITHTAEIVLAHYLIELAYGELTLYTFDGTIAYTLDVPNTGYSRQIAVAQNRIFYGGGNGPFVRVIKPAALSVSGPTADPEILVFPNPAVERISLQFGERIVRVEDFAIYTLEGRLVHTGKIGRIIYPGDFVQLPVNDLPAGQYALRVLIDGDWTSVSIQVQ